ncbi:S-methyl-5-thioribose-1-phosphate isomerase [Candidatus Woesearchaeota archaeon]|nr:S-methyl-5-thioribose-1-phosphate isomerase [Candidatus Woesearchaeota archaeon]
MKVNGRSYRTVWMDKASVFMIDQTLLPFGFGIYEARSYTDSCTAIKEMVVRGAGAIGAAAGYAMAQAILEGAWEDARKTIESTRPTAQNLFYATERVYNAALLGGPAAAVLIAQRLADEDVECCKRIGVHGAALLKDGCRIGTHCNAGWLAFVDFGTALSPVYTAHRQGKKLFVYADETRPRGQGARLTAWELAQEGIPHSIIPDNACAYFLSRGEIDIMIVGADRIARNGDVANKIGTLEKAICAKEYGVPFYVAAPTSTIDVSCSTGEDIPIEERSMDEVLYQTGLAGNRLEHVLVCSPGSPAKNPAFDVTPAKHITGIITEQGIFSPENITAALSAK